MDGPLEMLWGVGNFRVAAIFCHYQIPCTIFLGHRMNIDVHEFFFI